MNGDDDRIAYLAGADDDELDASDRVELDRVRALLADPAVWIDPADSLEDRVVASVERGGW